MAAQESAIQTNVFRAKRFLRGVWSELKKVSWPDRKELTAYTGVVFISVVVATLVIWIVDNALAWIMKIVLG